MARLRSKQQTRRHAKLPHPGICIALALLVVAEFWYVFKLSNEALFDIPSNDQDHQSPYSMLFKRNKLLKIAQHKKAQPIITAAQERPQPTEEQLDLIRIAKEQGLKNVDDRGPILEILVQAGLDLTQNGDLDQETIDQLPTWTQVQDLYGKEPRIVGLERCEEFRASVDPTTRFFGIAGTFNTGTNLNYAVMKHNCQINERMQVYGNESKGIRWQVPWGKHYMARFRETDHVTRTDADVPTDHVLPLVSIRDPYSWMQSMCRHNYAARWPHTKNGHCPNLIATKHDIRDFPILRNMYGRGGTNETATDKLVPVRILYSKELVLNHTSFAHWYSEWYRDYLDADYPRIMVRFEDLLFYGSQVARSLCECGGGVPVPDNGRDGKFVHISESAKLGKQAHGPLKDRTNLVGALIKYGTTAHRTDKMTPEDLVAARKYMDPKIMETFGYHHPPAAGGAVRMPENEATESGRYDDDHSQKPKKHASF